MRIGDRDFEIILNLHGSKDTGNTYSGSASNWYQKIWLSLDDRPFDGIESDLWHEIVEMIDATCNFKLGHQIITVLAMSLHQVFRDNKKFFEEFEEMVKKIQKEGIIA